MSSLTHSKTPKDNPLRRFSWQDKPPELYIIGRYGKVANVLEVPFELFSERQSDHDQRDLWLQSKANELRFLFHFATNDLKDDLEDRITGSYGKSVDDFFSSVEDLYKVLLGLTSFKFCYFDLHGVLTRATTGFQSKYENNDDSEKVRYLFNRCRGRRALVDAREEYYLGNITETEMAQFELTEEIRSIQTLWYDDREIKDLHVFCANERDIDSLDLFFDNCQRSSEINSEQFELKCSSDFTPCEEINSQKESDNRDSPESGNDLDKPDKEFADTKRQINHAEYGEILWKLNKFLNPNDGIPRYQPRCKCQSCKSGQRLSKLERTRARFFWRSMCYSDSSTISSLQKKIEVDLLSTKITDAQLRAVELLEETSKYHPQYGRNNSRTYCFRYDPDIWERCFQSLENTSFTGIRPGNNPVNEHG